MLRKAITRIRYPALIAGLVLCLLGVVQAATGNIDSTDKWAWSTNAGWINLRPEHGGVTVYSDHLEGYAWAENIGWIRLGTHEGGGAHTYGNASATDYGVNNDGSGNLSGYAWSTNAGWVNFNPGHSQVTIDTASGRFEGYAWSENVGWIHLSFPYGVVTSGGSIDTTDKYAWSTNAGWVNFNPTHGGGVAVYSDHLEGYAWSENIGWIRLGTHTGGGPHTYLNTAADDYGVNSDGSGNLSGYAWSTNAGWINFDPSHSQVTIDPDTGRFYGYAWSENVGWIHFDGPYSVETTYYPTCSDGVQNGDETDVDCGGSCPPCADGDDCNIGADCQSGVCSGGVCQAPTCSDGVQNGDETDVDCGGSCPPCADGDDCNIGADCQSGVCSGGVCQAPTCSDGVQNGDETDVDCGGSCPPCGYGDNCNTGGDCQSGVCTGGVCQACDFGDAPDPTYPTLLASTGASHILRSGVYLGNCVDVELDGQPSGDADGDDTGIGSPVFGTCVDDDDEDGVTFATPLRIGKTADIEVVASAPCKLSAWIDFNAKDGWSDTGEEIFSGQELVPGVNNLSFLVPADAVAGMTHARFRCTTDVGVTFTGQASDGEVEDYQVRIACLADLDGSGKVNAADLSALISQWGICPGCPEDLNGNGWVNLPDLSILVSQWGDCP